MTNSNEGIKTSHYSGEVADIAGRVLDSLREGKQPADSNLNIIRGFLDKDEAFAPLYRPQSKEMTYSNLWNDGQERGGAAERRIAQCIEITTER